MNGLFDESSRGSERARGSRLGVGPRRELLALALLISVLAALMLSALLGHLLWPSSSGSAQGASASDSGVVAATTGSPADVPSITAKVDPGLVDVNTNVSYQDTELSGTGIVLTPSGEVLTNNHVIEGATRISVTDIGNRRTYSATVVGYDPSRDVAVLQLRGASGLRTPAIGNTASASVGESIVGIGNGGGAGGTPNAAAGSITALRQSISAGDRLTDSTEQLSGLIEINAHIQAGDSGGPLVNVAGQVIGMDTAGTEARGYFGFQGETASQGYAIPIGTALAVGKEIEAGHGSAGVHVGATAFIGIRDYPTESASSGFGGPPSSGCGDGSGGGGRTSTVDGLEIESVVPGMPAAKAGLVCGDVVTAFYGHRVTTRAELSDLLLLLHPGSTAKITWTDPSGTSHTSTITLASGPAS